MFCNISVNITNLSLTLSRVNIAYSYPIRTLLLCVLDVLSSALMCCDVFALFALRSLSGYILCRSFLYCFLRQKSVLLVVGGLNICNASSALC